MLARVVWRGCSCWRPFNLSFTANTFATTAKPSSPFIASLKQCKDMTQVQALLKATPQSEMTTEHYNTLMSRLAELGQYEKVREVFEMMCSQNKTVTAVTYNVLMKAHFANNNHEQAYSVFKHMKSKGIKPTPATFSLFIDYLMANKSYNKAVEVLDWMATEDVKPNEIIMEKYLKAFLTQKLYDRALQVVLTNNNPGIVKGDHYPVLMNYVLEKEMADSAEQLFALMVRDTGNVDAVILQRVVDLLLHLKQDKRAEQLAKQYLNRIPKNTTQKKK